MKNKSFDLIVPATENIIPANLLGQNVVERTIKLGCQHVTQRLTIHPDAFRASRKFISGLQVDGCNLAGFNFSFLKDFKNLRIFNLKENANIDLVDWTSFPPLAALLGLKIRYMKLDNWNRFPILANVGLKWVDLSENLIGDVAIDRILQWLIDSKSTESLRQLDISCTFLTEIPIQISAFKNLEKLLMSRNPIRTIRSGSIVAPPHVSTSKLGTVIALHSCAIDTIEPDAFQGIDLTILSRSLHFLKL